MHAWLPFVDSWAEIWGAHLWRASWQGAIALGLALLIARTCTFLSPRVVCWVWRAAFAKMLLALVWVQPVSLAVLPPQPVAIVTAPYVFTTQTQIGSITESPAEPREISEAVGAAPWSDTVSLASVLLLLWGVGVCWRMLLTAWHWQALRQLRRSSVPTASELLSRLFHEERARLGAGARVRLASSPHAEGPLLSGIWRPLVILPVGIEEHFDERDLRIMLAHELVHVKRHDLAWNWLPTVTGWLFFFHPLVWLATRQWCEAQEAACDEALIQNQVTGAADYGRLLVNLAQCLPQQQRTTLAAAGVLGVYRNLERRIQGMACVRPFSLVRLLIAGALLTLVALPASVPWRLVAQEQSQPGAASKDQAKDPLAAQLPGKIYARAVLDFKNAVGQIEQYIGTIVVDPNTGTWEKLGDLGHNLTVSPDGSRYLYIVNRPRADVREWNGSDIWMADAKSGKSGRIIEGASLARWSPDGKSVMFKVRPNGSGKPGPTSLLDLVTMKSKQLPIPETDEADDWSRDGNRVVTVSARHNGGYQLYVMHPDATGERRLTEGGLNCYPRFSPDGKRLVYYRSKSQLGRLIVADVDGSNSKEIMLEKDDGSAKPNQACWSPDGNWLAVNVYDWQSKTTADGKLEKFNRAGDGNDRIEILAPDGSGRRELRLKGVEKVFGFEGPEWH